MTGARAAELAAQGTLAAALANAPLDPIERELMRAEADMWALAMLRAELARARARERR